MYIVHRRTCVVTVVISPTVIRKQHMTTRILPRIIIVLCIMMHIVLQSIMRILPRTMFAQCRVLWRCVYRAACYDAHIAAYYICTVPRIMALRISCRVLWCASCRVLYFHSATYYGAAYIVPRVMMRILPRTIFAQCRVLWRCVYRAACYDAHIAAYSTMMRVVLCKVKRIVPRALVTTLLHSIVSSSSSARDFGRFWDCSKIRGERTFFTCWCISQEFWVNFFWSRHI